MHNKEIKLSLFNMLALLFGFVLMTFIFRDGIIHAINSWEAEEYSHSYLIPFITAYLIWQRRDILQNIPLFGSWLGVLSLLFGLFLFVVGELGTLYVVIQYAFIIVLLSAALSFFGWKGFKLVAIPLLLLFFTIPLPRFIYNNLSAELQLISSEIGVVIIRLLGISVFLEGNVIDLGNYKLQVAEACNGLRYLFPLMTLGFISAYLFRQALWKKIFLFLSTIPITIIMNSFRIAVIGWLVEHWGISMAEGFLHDFEGWVIFMICFSILLLEMAILVRIGNDKSTFTKAFGLEKETFKGKKIDNPINKIPVTFVVSLIAMIGVLLLSYSLPHREEIIPKRESFTQFPSKLQNWSGVKRDMESIYIDALLFTDYLLADFQNQDGDRINYYVAYYDSQRKGQSAHSPRSCLPGGGWKIESIERVPLNGVKNGGRQVYANRVLTQYGGTKQLVYYWFKQRHRNITNEYFVKWFLFWDALTMNRTDGALVRITTNIPEGHDVKDADNRILKFAKDVASIVPHYVPD